MTAKDHPFYNLENYHHCARYRLAHNHLEQHPLIPPALKAELAKGEPKPLRGLRS